MISSAEGLRAACERQLRSEDIPRSIIIIKSPRLLKAEKRSDDPNCSI